MFKIILKKKKSKCQSFFDMKIYLAKMDFSILNLENLL